MWTPCFPLSGPGLVFTGRDSLQVAFLPTSTYAKARYGVVRCAVMRTATAVIFQWGMPSLGFFCLISTRRTRRGLCLDFGFSPNCILGFLLSNCSIGLRRQKSGFVNLQPFACWVYNWIPENGPRTQRPHKTRDSCFVAQEQHMKAGSIQFRSASRDGLVVDVYTS